MIPPANNPPMEISNWLPIMIATVLGGMMAPMTALDAVTAAEKSAGNRSRIMAGMRMGPSDAASASTDPEMPAKNMDVTMLTCASPPRIQPTSNCASRTSLSVISQRLRSSPVRTNIGRARSANSATPTYISVTSSIGGRPQPEKKMNTTQARPREIPTGTPMTSKTANGMNR